ncbi:MAG: beta-galactosidase trimerization domain-containing protein [Chlamydiota bacterium]
MKKKYIYLLAVCFIVFLVSFQIQKKEIPISVPKSETLFPYINGPEQKTSIPSEKTTYLKPFNKGKKSRFAIYLTDTDSSWLGLVRGLKSIGIPFLITKDLSKALEHRVVFAYPFLSGRQLNTPKKMEAMKTFLSKGGVLLTSNIYGALDTTLGKEEQKVSKQHEKLLFNKHKYTRSFLHANEQEISFANKKDPDSLLTATSFSYTTAKPIAFYEDNTAAIIQKTYGKGSVFFFGLDVGFFLNKSYNNRQSADPNLSFKDFSPKVDVFLRLLKEIYVDNDPTAITFGSVPYHRAVSVIITHDIDSTKSLSRSIEFAKLEKNQNAPSTYFVTTHYVKDYEEMDFFNPKSLPILQQIKDLGMDLASGGVTKSNFLPSFPIGSGKEKYPEYNPAVIDKKTIKGGSILGELRVSKFLLENLLTNVKCQSFRPNDLQAPEYLPQALSATQYSFSSMETASDVWTHLPFQLTYNRKYSALVPVFEFPVLRASLLQINSQIQIAKEISRYGGLFLLSIPLEEEFLPLERQIIKELKDISWFGSLSEFGSFWAARNILSVDVEDNIVKIQAPDPISGFSLEIPKGWKLTKSSSAKTKISQEGNVLIFDKIFGQLELTFSIR